MERGAEAAGGEFASADFHLLNSLRPLRILYFLRSGRDVVYTDADVLWRQDFVAELLAEMRSERVEIGFAHDDQGAHASWRRWAPRTFFCTGLVAALAESEFAQELLTVWALQIRASAEGRRAPQDDQRVFNGRVFDAWREHPDAFCARPPRCDRLRAIPTRYATSGRRV